MSQLPLPHAVMKHVFRVALVCLAITGGAREALAVCPSFGAAAPVTDPASDFVVADFNGDGIDDLAAAHNPQNHISVVFGDSSGTFDPADEYSTDGPDTMFLAAGDFDADGDLDLAIATQSGIVIRLNDGGGTFGEPVPNAVTAEFFLHPVSADFDHDGDADLAVHDVTNEKVVVLLSDGDGTFTEGAEYTVGTSPQDLQTGDFNADGNTDLAVANNGSSNVSILLGNSDATFAAAVNYAVNTPPYELATGDFDEDGRTDIALPGVSTFNNLTTLTILIANDDGTFAAPVEYTAKATSAAAADFDGDGNLDLVVTYFTGQSNSGELNVQIAFGNGDGTFDAPIAYFASLRASGVAAGDFNGDGQSDLAITANISGGTSIHLANGTCNRLPSITAGSTVVVVGGNSGVSATIATVSDNEDAAGTLTVTATSLPAGITVTGITNTSGTVTATVTASTAAAPGLNEVELTVQDSGGAHRTATLLVNVTVQGDANGDSQLTVLDIFFLTNYLLAAGPAPGANADANGDNMITMSDVDYLVAYFFAGGPPPV